MKKIDKLLLGAFAGPFMMTFLVVVFILLTQHMLKYFDDIIGKGLGWDVIGQLLFYFAIFMTPVALPLAVLLSSLIAFGNLGEHFELTAIKSSGISLVRTLRPIFFFVIVLTVIAFYANNTLVPRAALEAYSLLYDIKQKKPALDLREGTFFNGISDISIKVNKKFEDGVTLKEVIVYDHRKNDGNKQVTVADSGKMYTILNERYLKFELFDGFNYSEGATTEKEVAGKAKAKSESLTRSQFKKSQIVFDLSDFQMKQTDKKWFQGNRIMRNLNELDSDMDSMRTEIQNQRLNYYQYQQSYFGFFTKDDSLNLPPDLKRHQAYKDSLLRAKFQTTYNGQSAAVVGPTRADAAPIRLPEGPAVEAEENETPPVAETKSIVKLKANSKNIRKKRPIQKVREEIPRIDDVANKTLNNSLDTIKSQAKRDSIVAHNAEVEKARLDSLMTVAVDSIFRMEPTKSNYSGATNAARQVKQNIENTNAGAANYEKELLTFKVQWHKILASSMACIAMFLIGAPLGAIIKKGGLGMPFLVSILFFIIYYVITMQGEKLAKQGSVSPLVGVWLADAILFVIGLLFLRQARADARLFEADFYRVVFDKFKTWWRKRRELQPQAAS